MRKTTKAFILLGAVLVLLVGVRVIMGVLRPPNDKALILQALSASIKASKEGRPGGVMDKISANIKYNGENEGGNSREIARFIRNSRPEVTVFQMNPIVTGDEATIISPIDLSVSLLGINQSRHLNEVTMVFRKEEDHDWLIIPSRRWKLAEVHVPSSSVDSLFQP